MEDKFKDLIVRRNITETLKGNTGVIDGNQLMNKRHEIGETHYNMQGECVNYGEVIAVAIRKGMTHKNSLILDALDKIFCTQCNCYGIKIRVL